jgi:hypothetical protein
LQLGEAGDETAALIGNGGYSELPIAIMRAVEDYLEAHDGKLDFPIFIRVIPNPDSPTC